MTVLYEIFFLKQLLILYNRRHQIIKIAIHMEPKSQQNNSHDDNHTSPSTSTVRYLRDRQCQNQIRKGSAIDSELDRPNFCFNLTGVGYQVMRVYIDAISSPQIRLYYTKFTPKIKRGQICIIHGFGENSDSYLTMAEFFAKRGYVINMVDLRGFGYSGGSRIDQNAKKIVLDIQALLRTCCQRDLPTFIIAHGLGALFLNALLQQNPDLPISGVVNITPLLNFLDSRRSVTFQRFLLKILPSFFSNILVHNMINPTALAKDPMAIKYKIQSSFWESFITLGMADEFERVGQKVKREGYKFTYPTLFCCGGMDYIEDIQTIRKYYSTISSQDKQLIVFRDGYHELHTDFESDELMMKIQNWIQSRKNKIKWKQPAPFEKSKIIRRNRFWIKFGVILAIIMFLIKIIKRFTNRVI